MTINFSGTLCCLALATRACSWGPADDVVVGNSERQDYYVWDDSNQNGRIDTGEPPAYLAWIDIERADVPLAYTNGSLASGWVAAAVSMQDGKATHPTVPLGPTLRASVFRSFLNGGLVSMHVRSRMDFLAARTQRSSWICVEYANVAATRAKLEAFRDRTLDLNGLPWWQAIVVHHGFVQAVEERFVQVIDEKIVARSGVPSVALRAGRDFGCRIGNIPQLVGYETVTLWDTGDLSPEFATEIGETQLLGDTFSNNVGYISRTNESDYDAVRIFPETLLNVPDWRNFSRSEVPLARIRQVGTWIGNVATHELGHSYGLVSDTHHQGTFGAHTDPNNSALSIRNGFEFRLMRAAGSFDSTETDLSNLSSLPSTSTPLLPSEFDLMAARYLEYMP